MRHWKKPGGIRPLPLQHPEDRRARPGSANMPAPPPGGVGTRIRLSPPLPKPLEFRLRIYFFPQGLHDNGGMVNSPWPGVPMTPAGSHFAGRPGNFHDLRPKGLLAEEPVLNISFLGRPNGQKKSKPVFFFLDWLKLNTPRGDITTQSIKSRFQSVFRMLQRLAAFPPGETDPSANDRDWIARDPRLAFLGGARKPMLLTLFIDLNSIGIRVLTAAIGWYLTGSAKLLHSTKKLARIQEQASVVWL